MKTKTIWIWSAGLVLAALLPLAVIGDQESTNLTPVVADVSTTAPDTASFEVPDGSAFTNVVADEDVDAEEAALESAPGQVVSTAAPPATLKLSTTAFEIVKLAQAGLDESVMMA